MVTNVSTDGPLSAEVASGCLKEVSCPLGLTVMTRVIVDNLVTVEGLRALPEIVVPGITNPLLLNP